MYRSSLPVVLLYACYTIFTFVKTETVLAANGDSPILELVTPIITSSQRERSPEPPREEPGEPDEGQENTVQQKWYVCAEYYATSLCGWDDGDGNPENDPAWSLHPVGSCSSLVPSPVIVLRVRSNGMLDTSNMDSTSNRIVDYSQFRIDNQTEGSCLWIFPARPADTEEQEPPAEGDILPVGDVPY